MFEKHLCVKGGEQGSKGSRILYTLAPGAKQCKRLVKRDLQSLNDQLFKLYLFSFIMRTTCINLFLQAKSAQEIKVAIF